VVIRRRARGYSLLEIVVVMALFGVFLYILVTLTTEMRRNEKKWPVNFFAHPEVGNVLARMRRDILDSTSFPATIDKYSQSPTTLIVYTINQDGTAETVVWDFSQPGEVHRVAFKATLKSSEWMTHEDPIFVTSLEPMESGDEQQVHIRAIDTQGKLAIDEIFVPRPHA
jgi:prepilin-type N-terminal cleavage/methylation domain-containing protein